MTDTDMSMNINENDTSDCCQCDQAGESVEPEVQESGDELAEARAKIKELENKLALERAENFNERQRIRKESQATRQRTQDEVVTLLLPVLDVLDMALRTPVSESEADAAARNILKGVEMTRAQFLNILDNQLGVTVISVTKGTKFDHNMHNAAATVPVDDPELDGKVIDQQLNGYQSKNSNRVLRPAQVTVGKASSK